MNTDDAQVAIVDLFAGPGGWDIAAQQLGLPVTGIELDPSACATRRAAGLDTVEGDVRAWRPEDFPTATDLIGSPPCQPYSIAGKGAGRRALDTVLHFAAQLAARHDIRAGLATLDDERTGLVLEPLRWTLQALDAGRPCRTVMLEQVPTVLPVWETMAQILRSEGYTVVTGRMHAEEYGVPQPRARAVLVARRGDQHGPARTDPPPLQPHHHPGGRQSGSAALGVDGRSARLGDDPPPRADRRSRHGSRRPRSVLRRRLQKPRHPVRGTRRGPLDHQHPADGRRGTAPYRGGRKDMIRVSVADAAALQTFPPGHPFQGTRTKQYEQVGNAMPKRLAAAVIRRAMAAQLAARTGTQAA